MNSYTYELIHKMNEWINEYEFKCTNSEFWYEFISILIQIKNSLYPIWIHKSDFINMNSWYEFITEINENSIFWIHSFEFSGEITEIWHMNSLLWIQKNHNSDFCYEFIHEMNIYEFTSLISQESLWFV